MTARAPALLLFLFGCSSSPLVDRRLAATAGAGAVTDDAGLSGQSGEAGASPNVLSVFERIPQFGIYSESEPDYAPPDGVLMWDRGTVFMTELAPEQKLELGSTLVARITYIAQCDPYDRLGGLFFVLEPKGQLPAPADPRIELVRFVTPFSDYQRGALATLVFPDADVSSYARVLADPEHDVWLGIAGGSNPFAGDACTDEQGVRRAGVSTEFAAVGFRYSVELVSSGSPAAALPPSAAPGAISVLGNSVQTASPVEATWLNPGEALKGQLTVIISGHGSAAGGDEYRSTRDTVSLNDEPLGSFSTKIDCASYAPLSPDGNPGIFEGNSSFSNPRNWCPGALIPTHVFSATMAPGMNTVSVAFLPSLVPDGSGYATSVNFAAP